MAETRTYGGYTYEKQADGSWKRAGSAQPQMPADPTFPYQGAQAAATLANSQANLADTAIDNQRADRSEERQAGNTRIDNLTRLSQAYNNDPTVKAYRVAVQQLSQALSTGTGPQADLALTYAFAKAMDPDSVVREAEQGMVTNSQPFAQSVVENIKKQFGMDGAGNYTPEARNALRSQIISAVKSRVQLYDARRDYYSQLAVDSGFEPQQVIGQHDGSPYLDQFRQFDQQTGRLTDEQERQNQAGGGQPPRQMIPGTGGTSGMERSGGETYSTPEDVAVAEAINRAYRGGGSMQDMIAAAQQYGRPVTLQQATEWQQAIDYRDGTGQYQGKPGGFSPVNTPESGRRNLIEQAWGDAAATRAGTAGIGAANAFTMGGIDEITGGINALRTGNDASSEIAYANLAKQAIAQENPGSYLTGNLFGAGTQALGFGLAFPSVAAGATSTLPRTMMTGAAYGALNGALEFNDNRLLGAGGGAAVGAAGGAFGRYVAGPTANAVMGTQAGQAVSNAVRAGYNRLPQGLFGRVATTADVPNVPQEMRPVLNLDTEMAMNNLGDAARLGLPYSLADASPEFRALGGAVTRRSVNARGTVENIIEPRARGQAERAYEAIDTRLAPVTNLAERGQQWRQAAQTASSPLYAAGRQRAAPVDDRVAAFLNTPAGKQALKDARTMAANDGRDPNAMGFDLGEQGEVFIRELPSWETLDYVKRGIDQQLEGFRNPLTGALDLEGNPQAAALNGFRQRFVGVLDELNPDYKAARKAYEEQIRNRDALNAGQAAFGNGVRPRDLPSITGRFDPIGLGEFRRGYATEMADRVNDVRLSGNPYDRVFGTPNQQAKLSQIFPGGADDFGRIYGLEQDMARTARETIGGSPTAGRIQADAQMGDLMGSALEIGADALTGGGASGLGIAFNTGRRFLGDTMRLGIGKRAEANAERLAPVLFDVDAEAALNRLTDLKALQTAVKQRRDEFRRRGGLFGATVPVGAALAYQ